MILAVKAAAQYLGNVFSTSSIYAMVRQDQIPTIHIEGRKILFNSKRLDEWVENDCIMKDEWKRKSSTPKPRAYLKIMDRKG